MYMLDTSLNVQQAVTVCIISSLVFTFQLMKVVVFTGGPEDIMGKCYCYFDLQVY